jgi:hypothetical protein
MSSLDQALGTAPAKAAVEVVQDQSKRVMETAIRKHSTKDSLAITPSMEFSIVLGVLGLLAAGGIGALVGMLLGPLVWRMVTSLHRTLPRSKKDYSVQVKEPSVPNS